jgi:NADPH:quinone reductase-like Zn-dependent oxidoreductase
MMLFGSGERRFFGQHRSSGRRLSRVLGCSVAGLVRVVGSGDKVFDAGLAK